MNSKPADIDGYLEDLPDDKRSALSEMRRMIRAAAPDAVEGMAILAATRGQLGYRQMPLAPATSAADN